MSQSSNAPARQPARRSPGRPPSTDRRRAVVVALELLDEVGLNALTMRKLADALDVQVGTLYGYFATKQELLTEMAESMLAECSAPLPPDLDWTEQATELAGRLRLALLRFRDGARVYAGKHSTGPNTLSYADTFIDVLRTAGIGAADATRAVFTLINFTVGHTLEEQATAYTNASDLADDVDRLHRELATGVYPHLAQNASLVTGTDFCFQFEFGLRTLLHGLSALRPE